MAPGHMTLSEAWISMMTGSSPGKRCGILLNCFSLCIKSFSLLLLVNVFIIILFALQVKEYLKKEFQKHGYSPNDTHHEVMVEDIFKNEDEDKDGFISAREFTYQHDEL